MAKTRRLMQESLSQVDLVLELLDARIPYSSKNPEIEKLVGDKPRISVLTKTSLADPEKTRLWIEHYASQGCPTVAVDSTTGEGIDALSRTVREVMKDKLDRYKEKGMDGRKLKAMIVGIPNVGKSSLINRLAGGKKAKVENRPGVTLNKQWVPTEIGIDLLDMPGVLWPKFDEKQVGENLAITGAIKDAVVDVEELACILCSRLRTLYPAELAARYKLGDLSQYDGLDDWDLLQVIGRKRGFLVSGGEVNTERTSIILLDEFRAGTIGRITLDRI